MNVIVNASTQLLSVEDFPVQSQQTSRMRVLTPEERMSFPLRSNPGGGLELFRLQKASFLESWGDLD